MSVLAYLKVCQYQNNDVNIIQISIKKATENNKNFKISYVSTFNKLDYLKKRSRFLAVFCCFCLGILLKFVFTLLDENQL